MNKGVRTALALLLLFLIPTFALAWNFEYQIYGTILNSPARYSGILTSGGTGTVEFTLNDAGWPPPSDPDARFAYIWSTYFAGNYSGSPGAYSWTGTIAGRFAMSVASAPPNFNGTTQGGINAKMTIRDLNENTILDPGEKFGENLFDGRLSKQCTDPATGEMACWWGAGALQSNWFTFKYPPEMDTLYKAGNLSKYGTCPSDIEPASWGCVKALYR